ncbi:MAG: hypothetical protein ACLGQX_02755 [Acidobacteriota bacterium]
MPTRDEHVAKAEGNQSVNDLLDTASQSKIDWKLTISFYTAMHYVEAYLARNKGEHLRSHKTRDNSVASDSELCKVRTEYAHLKFYGYNARYEPPQFTAQDVKAAEGYLATLKAYLLPLL